MSSSSYLARRQRRRCRNVTPVWERSSTGRRPVDGPEGAPDRGQIVSRCRCRTPSPPTGRRAGSSAIPPPSPSPAGDLARGLSQRLCELCFDMRRSLDAGSCLYRRRLRSRKQSDDRTRRAPSACAARRAPADLYALRPRRRRAGVPRAAIAGTAARARRRHAASPAAPPRVRAAAGGGRDPRDSYRVPPVPRA